MPSGMIPPHSDGERQGGELRKGDPAVDAGTRAWPWFPGGYGWMSWYGFTSRLHTLPGTESLALEHQSLAFPDGKAGR